MGETSGAVLALDGELAALKGLTAELVEAARRSALLRGQDWLWQPAELRADLWRLCPEQGTCRPLAGAEREQAEASRRLGAFVTPEAWSGRRGEGGVGSGGGSGDRRNQLALFRAWDRWWFRAPGAWARRHEARMLAAGRALEKARPSPFACPSCGRVGCQSAAAWKGMTMARTKTVAVPVDVVAVERLKELGARGMCGEPPEAVVRLLAETVDDALFARLLTEYASREALKPSADTAQRSAAEAARQVPASVAGSAAGGNAGAAEADRA